MRATPMTAPSSMAAILMPGAVGSSAGRSTPWVWAAAPRLPKYRVSVRRASQKRRRASSRLGWAAATTTYGVASSMPSDAGEAMCPGRSERVNTSRASAPRQRRRGSAQAIDHRGEAPRRRARRRSRCPSAPRPGGGARRSRRGCRGRGTASPGRRRRRGPRSPRASARGRARRSAVTSTNWTSTLSSTARSPAAVGGRGDVGVEHLGLEVHGVAVAVGQRASRCPVNPTMSAWRAAWVSRSAPRPPTRIGTGPAGRPAGGCRGEVEVRAVVVDRLAVEQGPDDLDELGQAGLALGGRERTGRPIAANSAGVWPAPSPSSTRPPLRRSSVATSRATISGWCSPALSTNVPTRMRSVAVAAAARHCSGLQSLPTWSATSTVSKPSSSARRASAPDRRRDRRPGAAVRSASAVR